jgi:AraC-like DNA-binding protein
MELPKLVAAGIYDSRIAAKNVAISKNRKTTMFEFELPVECGGTSYIDANTSPIQPNRIICTKPGQIRHTRFPFKCLYVHMIVHSGALYDVLINTPDFFETDQHETYKRLLEKLIWHFNLLSEKEEIIIQSLILELIYTVSKDTTKRNSSQKSAGNSLIIENALQFISENLKEELSLEAVARQMSVSPVYFHTLFKASVGKTLRDYVEEQRIKRAITLLQTTDDSLTKIAFECGFSSQSYFSYIFKRRMKQTPRKYAQALYDKYNL